MRSLYQLVKNFHKEVESNSTVLRVIETLDINNLGRTALGVGISKVFWETFLNLMVGEGYVPNTTDRKIRLFECHEREARISTMTLNGTIDYYVLYIPSAQIMAVRSLVPPEEQSIIPSSFFQPSVYEGPIPALRKFVTAEGLSGNAFGGTTLQLTEFGLSLAYGFECKHQFSKSISTTKLNQVLDSSAQFDGDMVFYFTPLKERFETHLANISGRLKSELIRDASIGIILGEENKLLGFYDFDNREGLYGVISVNFANIDHLEIFKTLI